MAERLTPGEDGETGHLADLVGASNVLLCSPSFGSETSDVCHGLLTQTAPAATNVLAITFTKTPAEWIEEWTAHAGEPPAGGAILTIGETEATVDEDAWRVERVENAADLTDLGITLTDLLSAVAEDAGDDEALAVCFDSVTSLHQYTNLRRTFQFLHVVTGRVKTVEAIGHYHVDPAAHDDQELATLMALFDGVVEVDEEGAVSIRH